MTRFIICVDIDRDDLETAYRDLRVGMHRSNLEWETTDEVYDDNGEPINADELSKVRRNACSSEKVNEIIALAKIGNSV